MLASDYKWITLDNNMQLKNVLPPGWRQTNAVVYLMRLERDVKMIDSNLRPNKIMINDCKTISIKDSEQERHCLPQ